MTKALFILFVTLPLALPVSVDAQTIKNKLPEILAHRGASLDEKSVAYIHGKGIKVFSDLLDRDDNPDAYRKAVQYQIDLMQTDDVASVKKIYREFENHNK